MRWAQPLQATDEILQGKAERGIGRASQNAAMTSCVDLVLNYSLSYTESAQMKASGSGEVRKTGLRASLRSEVRPVYFEKERRR